MGLVLLPVDQAAERALTQQLVCWAKTARGMIDPRVVYETCTSITAETVGSYLIPGVLCGEYGPLPFTSQGQPIPCDDDAVLRPYIIFGTDLEPIDPDTCEAEGPLPPLPTPSFTQVGYIGPGQGSVLLQWSAPQAPNGVRVAIDPAGTSEVVPAGTSEYEVSGLETSVVYSYTITALGDGETSADSAPLSGTFVPLGVLPDPAGVSGVATSQSSVEISWLPVASATQYVVAVQTTDGTNVVSIEDAHSPQEVDNLSPGTTYNVTVFAWGQVQSSETDAVLSLESPGTNTVQVATMSDQLPPPAGVSAGPGPSPANEVEVGWSLVQFADDYRVEYSTDGTNWTAFTTTPGAAPPVVVAGLSADTTYQFRVTALDTTGAFRDSEPSEPVSATTAAA